MENDSSQEGGVMSQRRRSLHDWLDEYSTFHRNPTNKLLHWICVPLIYMSIIGMLWDLPLPGPAVPFWNCGSLAVALSLLFYVRLSPIVFVGMLCAGGATLAAIFSVDTALADGRVWQLALVVFVLAWVGQFAGHRIEGRQPAFFTDIQFLLVGPAWLLVAALRRLGVRV